MNTYLLFGGNIYYPSGGSGDFIKGAKLEDDDAALEWSKEIIGYSLDYKWFELTRLDNVSLYSIRLFNYNND